MSRTVKQAGHRLKSPKGRGRKNPTDDVFLKGQLPSIVKYAPPEELDTMADRVQDQSNWPIHKGARVRVRQPSRTIANRVLSYIGEVYKVQRETTGEHRGRVLVLVQTRKGERTTLPEFCTVVRGKK